MGCEVKCGNRDESGEAKAQHKRREGSVGEGKAERRGYWKGREERWRDARKEDGQRQ